MGCGGVRGRSSRKRHLQVKKTMTRDCPLFGDCWQNGQFLLLMGGQRVQPREERGTHPASTQLNFKTGNTMKLTLIAAAALLSTSLAHAALVQGTPTPTGQPANPSPLFGTLIDFDDVATGKPLMANNYAGLGVTSIASSIGTLGYYTSSQSGINYVGTGFGNNWNADILVEFTALQAAVGDRKSTRLNSSHLRLSRMPSSA